MTIDVQLVLFSPEPKTLAQVFFIILGPLRRLKGTLCPLALFIPPSHRSALKCSALKS